MSKLKTYPVDLLGTAPSNKVSGESRVIVRNEDRIFIPTGGPFYTKSLKIWSGAQPLTPGVDFRAKELNRNGTIDSGKEVCNAIQILNKNSDFLLEYQVIGGEYAELGEELADFIKGTPLGDLTKIHFDNILYKPTSFPPSPHTHVAADWRGYGDAVYIVEQLTAGLTSGREAVYGAVRAEIRRKVEAYVAEYIARGGVIVTDSTPTPNGNILLKGDGKSPTPLHFDYEAMFKELDERYFRNVINPLTRIGAISDSFLPISSGFFNVSSPSYIDRWSSAAGFIERNGDLICLLPASDGEVIRYVYGYVRRWTSAPDLNRYVTTNQQYRPPGLGVDEEIMELNGANQNCMIGTIFTIDSAGRATFKEHCIIELNGTLLQESHVITRLGNKLISIVTDDPNAQLWDVNLWRYRPMAVRMRDKKFYFFAMAKTGSVGTLSCFCYDPTADILTKVVNWTGSEMTSTYQHSPEDGDVLIDSTTAVVKAGQSDIRLRSWLKSEAVEGEGFIIADAARLPTESLGYVTYNQELSLMVEGDDVYLHYGRHAILTYNNNGVYRGDTRKSAGLSYKIRPHLAQYTLLRTRSDYVSNESHLTSAMEGVLEVTPDKTSYNYKYPMDCAGRYYYSDSQVKGNILSLNDGSVITWIPRGLHSTGHVLKHFKNDPLKNKPTELFNGFFANQSAASKGFSSVTVGASRLNLENPSPIPLQVGAYPMNDNLILLQEGTHQYTGGNPTTNYYIYRPSPSIVNYKTMDSGLITGLDTSDDRILIARNRKTRGWVSTRERNGVCRYSDLMFQSHIGTLDPPMVQEGYRDVKLDYANARFVDSDKYTVNAEGQSAINFAINSAVNGDIHPTFRTWALTVSPLQPDIAMLQVHWSNLANNQSNWMICAAKVVWNQNKELVSISFRPAESHRWSSNYRLTYMWDISRFRIGGGTGIEYNADKTEAHWHTRYLISMGGADSNTTGSSSIASYKLTFGTDGFPKLTYYAQIGNQDGFKNIVVTPKHTGIMVDNIAMGIYRVSKPFVNWDWVSGSSTWTVPSTYFCWYTPRPKSSFKLQVGDTIDVQIGGVFTRLNKGSFILNDPQYSSVIDPRNKTILIYATLIRGVATLRFEEFALAESIYTVYLGKCVTDEYGVVSADITPVSRIGNHRPSAVPSGAAFSASSGTAVAEQLLNWDADIPTTLLSTRVRAELVGPSTVQQYSSVQFNIALEPVETPVTTAVWLSLDPAIGTITQNGLFNALKLGTVNIRCIINDEIIAVKKIVVEESDIGVDMSQFTGQVYFDEIASYVKIVQDGKFFVKNRQMAIANFGGFIHVKSSGGVKGAMGYLNGHNIWKGKGTSWNRLDYSGYIVEGWNTVHMEWGDLWIEARLFRSIDL